MASEVSFYLLQFLDSSFLNALMLSFFFSFLVWEVPRFSKMLGEDLIKGLYPDNGRVIDFVILLVAFGSFLYMGANRSTLNLLPYRPVLDIILAVALLAMPLVIILGFIGRFFARMDAKLGVSAFLVQGVLDLCHTVFFICFSLLVLPCAALLLSYFM